MPDNINVEISTKKPVVAANLTELRYLVFQGMIGETGQSAYALAVELGFEGTEEDWIASLKGERGETLGWEVTDDGVGNVEMTYPDGVINSQKSVLFEEQTLTTAQKAQARENIDAAAASAVGDLTDTVEEHEAEITALENLSNNQASSDSVLELAARATNSTADGQGMGFALNDDGTFSIFGTNGHASNNAIFYTSAAGIASASALTPPAGVYRLEIGADQAADFTAVWGVLYIGNANQFVITDAVGKSVEVYLDGNTPVSSGIVVGSGKNANGLKLTIALRRIGTPELGELLVDQINQMQALQRKALSMLDTIRGAYSIYDGVSGIVNSGLYPTKTVASVVTSKDLNDVSFDSSYSVRLMRYNGESLNTPYTDGLTERQTGIVLDYHSGTNMGVQLGLPSGEAIVCVRQLYQSTWGSWVKIGGATSGT